MLIYIYIYIYIFFFFFLMGKSTKRFVFFYLFIHFVLTYEYVSSLLLSSSFIDYPINKALCHICSLMKATSWKHTHM